MSRRPYAAALAFAAFATACGPPSPAPSVCATTSSQSSPASAEGRWLLGQASRYPADTSLAARVEELHASQRSRRTVAWQAVARALAPVPLAHATSVANATVPRFRTWYDVEDVQRTFGRLYGGLSAADRAANARFSDTTLDAALGWNAAFVTTLPEWPADRLATWSASFMDGVTVAGITGIQRIGLSPDAVRHVVSSYPEILRCLAAGAPPTLADGPPQPQQMAHEPVVLEPCGVRTLGPFFVATGGRLSTRLLGTPADAQITVRYGVASTSPAACTGTAEEGCAVSGPGTFMVRVAAQGSVASGMIDVRYDPPTANATACLQGVFPPSAATVALEWRRIGIGIPFPSYDTSAAALARRLGPGGDATWGMGDGTAEPGADSIYTMTTSVGTTFRLAGMHIRTREVDRWLNITMWWSPDPDTDFGADRPDAVRSLGAPWSNYKMCVATDFTENDADPAGGFDADHPTLGASLRQVHEGQGGPSWCSNPYIDAGPGLVRSNCVGCHQHALSGVRPSDVQNDITHYPQNGRMQVRNNYPSDGFWGIDGGDRLGSVLQQTVDYYRASH